MRKPTLSKTRTAREDQDRIMMDHLIWQAHRWLDSGATPEPESLDRWVEALAALPSNYVARDPAMLGAVALLQFGAVFSCDELCDRLNDAMKNHRPRIMQMLAEPQHKPKPGHFK